MQKPNIEWAHLRGTPEVSQFGETVVEFNSFKGRIKDRLASTNLH